MLGRMIETRLREHSDNEPQYFLWAQIYREYLSGIKQGLNDPDELPPEIVNQLKAEKPLVDMHILENFGVMINGHPIKLSKNEYKLFKLLYENRGSLVRYDEVKDCIWKDKDIDPSLMSELINRIRSKIGDDSRTPTILQTEQKQGFRLVLY